MTYSFRTNGNFIDFVHTDNTNQAVESVLRSLHNTSRCVTWSLPEDTTRISFVVDDIRVDNFILTEIDFDGVAIDSQDDFETGITAMFPGGGGGSGVQSVTAGTNVTITGTATNPIINASGGGSSYLVYKGLVTGTNLPIVNVLENTLGGTVVWTRNVAGTYVGTLANAFTEGKTICIPFGSLGIVNLMIGSNTPSSFGYSVFRSNNNEIILNVFDDTYNPAELGDAIGNADLYIEVQVYP